MVRDGSQTGDRERRYGRCGCGNVANGPDGLCKACKYGPCIKCGNKANGFAGLCNACRYATRGQCPKCAYTFTPKDGANYVRAKSGERTYCPTCQPYGTGEWIRLAHEHIANLYGYPYGYECVYGCGRLGTHGDHVFPKSVWSAFANESWNLVPACSDHNHYKSARDPLDWLETVQDSAPFWKLLEVSALGQVVRFHRQGKLRSIIRKDVK